MTRPARAQLEIPGIGGSGKRPVARIRRGVDAQLKAQRDLGSLEKVDDGLIAIARTLADAADAEHVDTDGSRYTVGALLGRLVPVLLELRGDTATSGGTVDDELEQIVAAIRDSEGS